MRDLMAVTKALADENRVRVLVVLGRRELCVCQIVEFLGLAPLTVSKHLAILNRRGFVEGRKKGRWMFYRATRENAATEAAEMSELVRRLLAGDPQSLPPTPSGCAKSSKSTATSCVGGKTDAESLVFMHGQLVSKPDGRGLDSPFERRPDRGVFSRRRAAWIGPRRRPGDGRGGRGYFRPAIEACQRVSRCRIGLYCDRLRSRPRIVSGGGRKAKVVHVGFDDPPRLAAQAKTEAERLAPYRRVRDEIKAFVLGLPEAF